MTTPALDIEDDSEIGLVRQEGLALLGTATKLKVVDAKSFGIAGDLAKALKGHIERVKEFYKPIKERERKVWQATVDDEKKMLEGPQAAYQTVSAGMIGYENEQRRKREEAEREAAKAAELAQAEALKTGKPTVPMVIPPQAVAVPEADGINFRTTWVAEVTDKVELARAVADGKLTPDVFEPNMVLLNEFARAMKGGLKIPGVKAVEKRGMSTRRA